MRGQLQVLIKALLLCSIVISREALAVNIGFLPGDACFHARLTEDLVNRLASEPSTPLGYAKGKETGGDFCGYAGYWSLIINDPNDLYRTKLGQLYRDLRLYDPQQLIVSTNEAGKESTIETNGFHLFVYNADFTGPIGLKLNEHWMADLEPLKTISDFVDPYGSGKKDPGTLVDMSNTFLMRGEYEPFVTDYRAVAIDWRRAADFPSLSVKIPDGIQGIYGPRIKVPLTVEASEVKLVVLPKANVTPYTLLERGEKHHYFALSQGGIMKSYFSKSGKLVEVPWPSAGEVDIDRDN